MNLIISSFPNDPCAASTPFKSMKQAFIDVPAPKVLFGIRKAFYYAKGAFLSPVYWLLSHCFGMPGLTLHRQCARLGFHLFLKRQASIPNAILYELLFKPMDSTRYFEFDFVWQSLHESPVKRYLDVASPRMIPLLLLWQHTEITAELINPDKKDMAITQSFVEALGMGSRCHLHNVLIDDVPFEKESFDTITCISVLEHIPESDRAIRKIWDLLKKGGKLILTLPCMAEETEQYINDGAYGLLPPGPDGYTFWQLYYDQALLEEKIYGVIGKPARIAVFGEKRPGSFAENAHLKRLGNGYPFWREPYMVGTEYTFFDSIDNLPGEGVVAIEAIKT